METSSINANIRMGIVRWEIREYINSCKIKLIFNLFFKGKFIYDMMVCVGKLNRT